MEFLSSVVGFVLENKVVILACLFAVSEALSLIPQVKSNGVFQFIFNAVKSVYEKVKPTALPK